MFVGCQVLGLAFAGLTLFRCQQTPQFVLFCLFCLFPTRQMGLLDFLSNPLAPPANVKQPHSVWQRTVSHRSGTTCALLRVWVGVSLGPRYALLRVWGSLWGRAVPHTRCSGSGSLWGRAVPHTRCSECGGF